MDANNQPYEILTGVGTLYRAAVGTAFPSLTAQPGAAWTNLGETDGGVKITPEQETKTFTSDQRTGPVKAVRVGESLTVETNLKHATLENIGLLLGASVTDTPPGAGTIGTRELPLHRGSTVNEYAFLFRHPYGSPYGNFPAQYELPRGFFDGPAGQEYKKDGEVLLPVKFTVLEDTTAGAEADRFGRLVAQDAAAA